MDSEREKWLKWRQDGIGSSDAAAVMGFSPYKTAQQIFEDKISPVIDEPSNFILQKGNEMEPIARRQFSARYNMEHDTEETFDPMICEMKELPFFRASLDGISKDGKTLIEIKYQGKVNHANVAKGEIVKHYWIQMQHQFLVSGAERGFLVSINEVAKGVFYHEVRPDEKYLKEHIARLTDFWAKIVEYRAGHSHVKPDATDQDWVEVEGDKPIVRLVEKWKAMKMQIDAGEKQLDIIKQEILNLKPAHPKVRISGLNITLTERKGNVNYAKIPELKNVDLEKYRGLGSTYYTFKLQGEK